MQFLQNSSKISVKSCNFWKIWTPSNVFFKDFFYFSGTSILWSTFKWLLLWVYFLDKRDSIWHLSGCCTLETIRNILLNIILTLLCLLCETGRPINPNSDSGSKWVNQECSSFKSDFLKSIIKFHLTPWILKKLKNFQNSPNHFLSKFSKNKKHTHKYTLE